VYKFKSFIKQWWGILFSIPLIALLLACVIAMTYFRCNNFSISASADSGVVAYADECNSSSNSFVVDTTNHSWYSVGTGFSCYQYNFKFKTDGYYELYLCDFVVDDTYTFVICYEIGWETKVRYIQPAVCVYPWGHRTSLSTVIDNNTKSCVVTAEATSYQFLIDRGLLDDTDATILTGTIYVFKGSYSGSFDVFTQLSYAQGYSAGYSQGKIDGYAAGTYDEATTPTTWYSYILTIADVPFNLISNMLNFELFGVNIGNFAFAIITGAIVLSLIKLLI
jgi:hypothetical protein